jgi:tetratricopeptide (TPR) repeat protein
MDDKGTMKGHWTSHVLAEVLRDLYFSERSGSLSLTRDNDTRVLIFDRGMLQFAYSSREDMNLGPRLVRSGVIEPSALNELPRLSSPTDLPQVLINQGLIDKSGLDAPIRELVRESVEEAFSWPEGLYHFREGWLLKDVFDSNVLFTFETILKGIARLADFGPVREVLLQIDKPVSINPSIFLPVEKLGLTANEGFVLSRVDGRTPIRDIVALVPPAIEEATCRFLYGVLVLGMVQFEAAAPGQRMFSLRELVSTHREAEQKARQQRTLIRETYLAIRTQAPYAVLGLSERAGVAEARSAYEAARQRFAPESFLPEVQAELKEELQIIESRLVEAFLALQESQVHHLKEAAEKRSAAESQGMDLESFSLRREVSKSETRLGQEERQAKAQEYYQMARRAFQKADYQNCLTYCQESLRHEPLAMTHALLGDVLVRNPDRRWQRQAEDNYQKAIEMDPWNPDHLVALGRLYRGQGLQSRARKVIEKAVEITPNHAEARAILAELHLGVDPEPQLHS